MNWFNNWRVGTKLISGFLLVAFIGGVIGVQGIFKAGQINDMATLMYARDLNGLRHAAEANMHLLAVGRGVRSAVLAGSAEDRDRQISIVEDRIKGMHEALTLSGKQFATERGKALVAQTHAAAGAYTDGIRTVIGFLRNEPLGEARQSVGKLFGDVRAAGDQADDLMSQLVSRKESDASDLNDATDRIYEHIRLTLICLTIGGVLVGIGVGVLLTRGLTRQLGGEPRDVADAATTIASGDLGRPIDTSRARPGSIVHAMDMMRASLRDVVGEVRSSSENIVTGSNQIALGNADLSQRTEVQASNLQQTAASMEELASAVESNATSARQVSALANSALTVATRGGEAVGSVVKTMQEIETSSKKVSEIIGVIDGIAFQTNILALNAAVEAARAGEQGRGFAVVASEVRMLAQRSAAAAREIKALIEGSAEKVLLGNQLVSDAGATIRDVITQVHQVSEVIRAISLSTTEQTSGINEVSNAMMQLDQVTQQNAALVEESAAAADSLSQQARRLADAVGIFRVDMGASGPAAGRIGQAQHPALGARLALA